MANLPINQFVKKKKNQFMEKIGSLGDKVNIITAFKMHLDAF